MTQSQVKQLLRRYLDGQASDEELRLIDRWYDSLNESVAYQFSADEQSRIKARMWATIEAKTTTDALVETPVRPLNTGSRTPFWRRSWTVAAAAAALLVGGWLGWRAIHTPVVPPGQFRGELATVSAGLVERNNTTSHALRLILSDGSSVVLTPNSAVRYPARFAADHRDVYLTGSAFFSVSKDPQRPFRVSTDRVVTQVLGTSFWMKTTPDADRVDVDVITGKVSVFARKPAANAPTAKQASPGVVLTPNQKVTVFGDDLWQTGLVAKPEPIRPDVPDAPAPVVALSFDEVPLSTVLDRLSNIYGIDMDLANGGLSACTFSGNISNLPLYTQLDLICRAVGADYAVRGTRILISGRGCNL
ncbi:FecR domain-containing protein [Fibrella sp. HMF5335]|uniref:FecR domain-containing protein n=1 Tax=Fibrella rubiginis TaxID=2817060 RepID=A0A939K594_9BACT|nr:FecR family protein [Fibrella rubiginis]MBO0937016.1 FecR domain-containing protein [Fibrella rubiginis]